MPFITDSKGRRKFVSEAKYRRHINKGGDTNAYKWEKHFEHERWKRAHGIKPKGNKRREGQGTKESSEPEDTKEGQNASI